MAKSLVDGADRLREWAVAADADPAFSRVVLTQAERDVLVPLYARVAASGFTADEVAQFHALGYTDAQTVATQRLVRLAPSLGLSDAAYAKVMTAQLRVLKKLGRP